MRAKEKIMKDALNRHTVEKSATFDTFEEKHSYLMVELLCDLRDDQVEHNLEMERLTKLRLGI